MKSKKPEEINIDQVLEEMRNYHDLNSEEELRVRKAFEFAENAHAEFGIDPRTGEFLGRPQKRKSGELYIQHPLWTALILARKFHADPETVVVGLLHDVVEDTAKTAKDIEKVFGKEVAKMCLGLEKLAKVRFEKGEDRQIGNLRRMFVAMADDMRVIFVKLADRLHNMRTLDWVRVDKRERIAKETLEIFAPLAYRLGIFEVKAELENLCFKHLHPVDYLQLMKELTRREEEDRIYVDKVGERLQKIMEEEGITGRIRGRLKHHYSVFKKMKVKGKQLDEIYDRVALRVIVPTKKDCYALLGAVHSKWQVKLGKFKDYIAMPKANKYQSLHTVIFPFLGEDRQPTEIQIRTEEMHQEAEYGLAAHWLYSEGGKKMTLADDRQKQWIEALQQIKSELVDTQFAETLKSDLLENRIFVFTPHGRVIDLPSGATPIDFAHAVHTEVGKRCFAAKVDGKIVTLDRELHNGQTVEILTKKSAHPTADWLSFAKTSLARNKIRQFLRGQNRDKNIAAGKARLEKELKTLRLKLDKKNMRRQEMVLKGTPYQSFDDLLVAIGTGGFSVFGAIGRMFPEAFEEEVKSVPKGKRVKSGKLAEIVVDGGAKGMKIGTRACCEDDLGKQILGFVTRGKGIAIHRADCSTIKNADPSRMVAAHFKGKRASYKVSLAVFSTKARGVFRNAIAVFEKFGVDLGKASFFTGEEIAQYNPIVDGVSRVFVFEFKIDSFGELQEIFESMERLVGVLYIRKLDR